MRLATAYCFLVFSCFGIQTATVSASDSAVLTLQPRAGYQFPRFFQNSQTAAYPGVSYGAQIFYRIPLFSGGDDADSFFSSAISIAPVISLHYGKFDNSANSATQRETLTEKSAAIGLKLYINQFFILGQYAWADIQDDAHGVSNTAIRDRSTGLGGGLGYVFSISSRIGVEISAEAMSVTFPQRSGGFATSTQYLRFGGFFGLNIAIPSTVAPSTSSSMRSKH